MNIINTVRTLSKLDAVFGVIMFLAVSTALLSNTEDLWAFILTALFLPLAATFIFLLAGPRGPSVWGWSGARLFNIRPKPVDEEERQARRENIIKTFTPLQGGIVWLLIILAPSLLVRNFSVLFTVLVVLLARGIVVFATRQKTSSTAEPVVNYGSDWERKVWERIPAALIDYYSPKSEDVFKATYPLRSAFRAESDYQDAKARIDAELWERRLANARDYIVPESIRETSSRGGSFIEVCLKTRKTNDESLMKHGALLAADLEAYGVQDFDYDARVGFVGFKFATAPLSDEMALIVSQKTSSDDEFYVKHRRDSLTSYLAGVDAYGELVYMPRGHTLVFGLTGAGKGSVFRGRVAANAPLVRDGLCVQYVIDPKNGEAKAFKKARQLFKRIETDADAMADVVDEVYEVLKSRQERDDEWNVGRDMPIIELFVDELPSLLVDKVFIARKDETRNGMNTKDKLIQILAQGRSDRIYVVAATQFYVKEVLGALRDNFMVRIPLRTEGVDKSAHFIGVQESDLQPIGESNEDNGWATAGVGYMKIDGHEKPKLLRFGYMSNAKFAELGHQYAPIVGATSSPLLKPATLVDTPDEPKASNEEETYDVSDEELDAFLNFHNK